MGEAVNWMCPETGGSDGEFLGRNMVQILTSGP